MATNDFLKFAYGVSANKVSQAAYAVASWLGLGFPTTGIDKTAYSNQLNKVWSQSSFWAQVMGDAIVSKLNKNVVDDGDSTGKLVDFLQTMQLAGVTTPVFSIAAAAAVDLGAAEAVAGGGVASHFVRVTGSTGPITSFGSTADVSRPVYMAQFASTPTITAGANLVIPGVNSGASITAAANDLWLVEYLGSGAWRVLAIFPGASVWQSGSNANGFWEKRPSGIIEQWGTFVGAVTEGHYTFTFPIQFPNSCDNVQALVVNNSSASNQDIWAQWDQAGTNTSAGAIYLQWDGQPNNNGDGYAWRAIGR